jgi:hypothetical protein
VARVGANILGIFRLIWDNNIKWTLNRMWPRGIDSLRDREECRFSASKLMKLRVT